MVYRIYTLPLTYENRYNMRKHPSGYGNYYFHLYYSKCNFKKKAIKPAYIRTKENYPLPEQGIVFFFDNIWNCLQFHYSKKVIQNSVTKWSVSHNGDFFIKLNFKKFAYNLFHLFFFYYLVKNYRLSFQFIERRRNFHITYFT